MFFWEYLKMLWSSVARFQVTSIPSGIPKFTFQKIPFQTHVLFSLFLVLPCLHFPSPYALFLFLIFSLLTFITHQLLSPPLLLSFQLSFFLLLFPAHLLILFPSFDALLIWKYKPWNIPWKPKNIASKVSTLLALKIWSQILNANEEGSYSYVFNSSSVVISILIFDWKSNLILSILCYRIDFQRCIIDVAVHA